MTQICGLEHVATAMHMARRASATQIIELQDMDSSRSLHATYAQSAGLAQAVMLSLDVVLTSAAPVLLTYSCVTFNHAWWVTMARVFAWHLCKA